MPTEPPGIAKPGYGRVGSVCGRCPVSRILGIKRGNLFEDEVNLRCFEAGDLHLVADVDKVLQFLCGFALSQPASSARRLSAIMYARFLSFAEVLNPNCRDGVPAQLLDGLELGAARKDGVFPIDYDGPDHPKLLDRQRQLRYLSLGVNSRVG